MNLHQFFLNRKKEDESVKDIITAYLESKAKIYSYRKKEELLKQLIKLFNNQAKKLVNLNNVKDKFIGIISHELKNSINIIQNYAEYALNVKKQEISKDIESILKIIFNSAVNTGLLLDNLLDFSSIREGRVKVFVDNLDIVGLIDNIVIANTAIAEFKNISIKVVHRLDSFVIKSDRYKIYQIISNILSNAIKYTPEGKNIYIDIKSDNEYIYISVTDEGIGIPDKMINNIFMPYSKILNRPTGGEKSTGLGLFITKYLVEAIGGRIEVKSKVNEGTTFTVILPINYELK